MEETGGRKRERRQRRPACEKSPGRVPLALSAGLPSVARAARSIYSASTVGSVRALSGVCYFLIAVVRAGFESPVGCSESGLTPWLLRRRHFRNLLAQACAGLVRPRRKSLCHSDDESGAPASAAEARAGWSDPVFI